VRTKVMISGAIAAIGLATLTANAGSNVHTSSQQGVVSLIAGTRTIVKADRDEIALGTRSATTVPASTKPATRPVAAARPAAPRFTLSASCQAAINTLKALHQADVAEDAAERARQQPVSAAVLEADRAEDLAEAQQWRNALTAARAACLPAPSAACQAAISNLHTLLQATRTLAGLKAAFGVVATACGHRD
jgi:hypothetical protein